MLKKYEDLKAVIGQLDKLKKLTTELNESNEESPTIKEQWGIDLEDIENLKVNMDMLNAPKIKINFINKSSNVDPSYFHEGDSGFDLRAHIPDYNPLKTANIMVEAGKTSIIPTGLYFEIPRGYELQVRPRSGLAAKFSITVLNTPGTVDSNYRGEIKIILINLGETDFQIENGDRIAQGVIAPVLTPQWSTLTHVTNLDSTTRGEDGFGSTGKK